MSTLTGATAGRWSAPLTLTYVDVGLRMRRRRTSIKRRLNPSLKHSRMTSLITIQPQQQQQQQMLFSGKTNSDWLLIATSATAALTVMRQDGL